MRGEQSLKKTQLFAKSLKIIGKIGVIFGNFLFNSLDVQAQILNSPPPETITPPLPPSSPQPILPPSQPQETPLTFPNQSPTPSPDFQIPSGSLTVTGFTFANNTVFSDKELAEITIPATNISLASVTPDNPLSLSFPQLLQIASQIADYYAQRGYQTSGAIIAIPDETQQLGTGVVILKVIEGKLEQINVTLADKPEYGRLGNYVRSRLGVDLETPLNVSQLLTSLQLLQLDPLIQSISAQLTAGSTTGENILNISYLPADSFSIPIILDNARSPSVGSFERGISLEEKNLFGLGDSIRLGYLNTDGSNLIDFSYRIPFTANNSTLRFDYTYNDNQVVEPPFNDINLDGKSPDITSNYQAYDLSIYHPLIRSIDNSSQTYSELILGLSASWEETQSFLFGQPFPFALSADINGNTRIFALRFSQEFTQQNPSEVLALRSEFNFGLNAFGSTIVEETPGVGVIPDSRFFAWRGQFQYVNALNSELLFLVRSNIQLAADSLLPLEQFSLGGLYSVRGYRQDQLLTDSGFFLSAETRFLILQTFARKGSLQLIPFLDYGVGWNANGENPSPNNLVSVGLGLLYSQGNLTARFDWGIPLVDVPGNKTTWQENGLYFSIQYSLF